MEEKIEKTVEWIRKKVNESGTKGILVGLSGGIDSSVVAFLLKKAFPENSLGVILPCKSNDIDKEDALKVAKKANIKFTEVDLTEVHSMLYGGIRESLKDLDTVNHRLSDANLRARLRMSTLYGIANNLGYLVAGTDNAAEVYTGYFTKYGDGGVDIIPIANITKREVYEWAKVLGVPESVIVRPPSAGLWEGQTDEKEMGTTYDMIDDLIEGKIIPEEDRKIIESLHNRSNHKREMPPKPPIF
ncbi:NAD(+) synthase [Helicovermis profundi]|uniref:NAD(+) synthase n=1 Tax=Helicovermis profundi TaxID=3065157 RepID=UPI0030CB44E3